MYGESGVKRGDGEMKALDTDAIISRYERQPTVVDALARAIYARALLYTPVKTGKLKQSASLEPLSDSATIRFSEPYAVYVHEIPFNRHKPPTGMKFLEQAEVEVGLGSGVPITISYDPLELYINQPDKGSSILPWRL